MDYINSLVNHGFHGWEDTWNTEATSQTGSTRGYDIGDSNKPRIRDSFQSARMKLADVAGSNQADPKICIRRHEVSLLS
jgi:hypothetical protein